MAAVTTDFEDFVGSHHQRWVRVGVLAGWPQQDVEDAVQRALSTLWRRWRRVSTFDNPDAYVMKVVINSLKKDAARRSRQTAGADPQTRQSAATNDGPQEQVARSALVRSALSELAPEQRATIVLRYFLDLSEKDTADVLGVAVGTVKSRTSRALAALAANRHLEEYQER